MARYIQKWNEETQTSTFVEVGRDERKDGHFVHGDIESFVSPIDGSVVSDRKQYAEHCRKHGVVPAQEFSPEHYRKKTEERNRQLSNTSEKERRELRQEMYNIATHLERKNG